MEGACPGRATPTNWRCGRAARQLVRRTRGTRKPCQVGTTFALATGGDRARGCGGCKGRGGAAAGAYGRRMRCAATFRTNLGAEVHATWLRADAEQNLFTRGTRGLSDVGSARGACAAAAALRGHARVVQARVRRGVPSGWGALASQEEPPSKFSNGRAKCRFKRRGEGYCSRTPGTNRKAVGLETCRVNPSHTNLLHHLSQKLSLLLVLLVHSVCGGAIHVNKLPRPSSHYYRP